MLSWVRLRGINAQCLTPSPLASWYQFTLQDNRALVACSELFVRKSVDLGIEPATLWSPGRSLIHTTTGPLHYVPRPATVPLAHKHAIHTIPSLLLTPHTNQTLNHHLHPSRWGTEDFRGHNRPQQHTGTKRLELTFVARTWQGFHARSLTSILDGLQRSPTVGQVRSDLLHTSNWRHLY